MMGRDGAGRQKRRRGRADVDSAARRLPAAVAKRLPTAVPASARSTLLAVARARPGDPRLLHAGASGAGDRRHRRRARNKPLDHPPLRDHTFRARLPQAGRLAKVPARAARHRPRHGRLERHRAARARPSPPRRAATREFLHHQSRRARRRRDRVRHRARSYRRGQDKIDLGLASGSRLPAYCTAMGKVLLANLPEGEQSALLASIKPTKRGPNTITSKNALRVELDADTRGRIGGQRPGAGEGASRGRRPGALGVRRGRRRGQPRGAHLDDLAGVARATGSACNCSPRPAASPPGSDIAASTS